MTIKQEKSRKRAYFRLKYVDNKLKNVQRNKYAQEASNCRCHSRYFATLWPVSIGLM